MLNESLTERERRGLEHLQRAQEQSTSVSSPLFVKRGPTSSNKYRSKW